MRRTIVPIVSVQNRYSVADRGIGRCSGILRKAEDGLYSLVPAGGRSISGADNPNPSCGCAMEGDAITGGSGMAALTISSHAADSREHRSVAHLEENVAAAGLKIDENKMQELGLTA